MTNAKALQITTRGDREIVMTRVFNAPRTLVWDAFTRPELMKKWFIGPPGWSLAVCEVGKKAGDKYRYVWRGPDGVEMGMGGVVKEFVPPERLVATERFDEAWYPGEAVDSLVFTEKDGKTTLTHTILLESRAARDIMLKSPMENGVSMNYNRLDEMLAGKSAEVA